MTAPTPQGLLRYPDTSGRYPESGEPCTCTPECPLRCDGRCGCKACRKSYLAFFDFVNFRGPGKERFDDEAHAAYDAGVLLGDFPGDGLAVTKMERAPPPRHVPYGRRQD